MNPNSKDFEKLKKKWYDKLKKSGFQDIESADGQNLTTWSSKIFKQSAGDAWYQDKEVYYQSREEYFRMAGAFFWDYGFQNKLEKSIWELHMQGTSIRDIVTIFKKKNIKVYRRQVHEIIQKLVQEMFKIHGISK
jgi:hypothetical protein